MDCTYQSTDIRKKCSHYFGPEGVLFDFLSFATEIFISYREEAELPNDPKVVTLNIFWSRAIDGHWHAIFLVLSN